MFQLLCHSSFFLIVLYLRHFQPYYGGGGFDTKSLTKQAQLLVLPDYVYIQTHFQFLDFKSEQLIQKLLKRKGIRWFVMTNLLFFRIRLTLNSFPYFYRLITSQRYPIRVLNLKIVHFRLWFLCNSRNRNIRGIIKF